MTDKKITLAVDSSGVPLLLALDIDGKTYTARHSGMKQEEYLFPLIKKLLAKAGCTLKDTTNVLFIKGPGRFTGIRIGITIASMLRELIGAQLAGITVFDGIKYQAINSKQFKMWYKQNPSGKLAVILHAFREEFFISIDGKQIWLPFDGLLDLLDKESVPLFIAGWGKDAQPLEQVLPAKYAFADKKINFMQAKTMIALSRDTAYQAGPVLEPLYLKPARFELGK